MTHCKGVRGCTFTPIHRRHAFTHTHTHALLPVVVCVHICALHNHMSVISAMFCSNHRGTHTHTHTYTPLWIWINIIQVVKPERTTSNSLALDAYQFLLSRHSLDKKIRASMLTVTIRIFCLNWVQWSLGVFLPLEGDIAIGFTDRGLSHRVSDIYNKCVITAAKDIMCMSGFSAAILHNLWL